MKVGVFPGKFLPPHRGHLTSILRAHAECDLLYVAVSDNPLGDGNLCKEANIPYISGANRKMWLMKELSGIDNIKVILIDESKIPQFPDGWNQYAKLIITAIPEKINIIFGGEESYREGHDVNFPGIEYRLIDPTRSQWFISGTKTRFDVMSNWDFLLGAARPFFAKKVLVTGTESCGKSTITKKLAKIFYTSWSEELGRYYSERYLGNDDSAYTTHDFERIAYLQYEQDLDAMNHANKICFFDTDAVVTEFYRHIYLPNDPEASKVRDFYDPSRYDLVLFMTPEVKWVDDGTRFLGGQSTRTKLADKLYKMYMEAGFDPAKIVTIRGGDYSERLTKAIDACNGVLK
jgi:HTH-type transcriptional regulator, transcriptional repressor of NAD biosynthesis genes